MENNRQLIKEIIKQEWEAEFPEAAALCIYENSLAVIYEQMIEKVCIKVWNSALELAADRATTDTELDECDGQSFEQYVVDKYSILKHKVSVVPEVNFITPVINEQGTNTTEV